MKINKKKPYWEMNTAELAAATRQFDRSMIIDESRPLSPKMRARWERAKRKLGRPMNGAGAKVISVSVEKNLLAESDALARKMKLTRAGLIAQGLKIMLARGVARKNAYETGAK